MIRMVNGWTSLYRRRIGLNHIHKTESPTGTYSSILNPDGDLFVGVLCIFNRRNITIDVLCKENWCLRKAKVLLADCNLSFETLRWLMSFCETENIPLIIETVSVPKAIRLEKALPGKVLLIKTQSLKSSKYLVEIQMRIIQATKGSPGCIQEVFSMSGWVHLKMALCFLMATNKSAFRLLKLMYVIQQVQVMQLLQVGSGLIYQVFLRWYVFSMVMRLQDNTRNKWSNTSGF